MLGLFNQMAPIGDDPTQSRLQPWTRAIVDERHWKLKCCEEEPVSLRGTSTSIKTWSELCRRSRAAEVEERPVAMWNHNGFVPPPLEAFLIPSPRGPSRTPTLWTGPIDRESAGPPPKKKVGHPFLDTLRLSLRLINITLPRKAPLSLCVIWLKHLRSSEGWQKARRKTARRFTLTCPGTCFVYLCGLYSTASAVTSSAP